MPLIRSISSSCPLRSASHLLLITRVFVIVAEIKRPARPLTKTMHLRKSPQNSLVKLQLLLILRGSATREILPMPLLSLLTMDINQKLAERRFRGQIIESIAELTVRWKTLLLNHLVEMIQCLSLEYRCVIKVTEDANLHHMPGARIPCM